MVHNCDEEDYSNRQFVSEYMPPSMASVMFVSQLTLSAQEPTLDVRI